MLPVVLNTLLPTNLYLDVDKVDLKEDAQFAHLHMYTANEGLVRIQYKCLIWNLIHSQTK